MFATAVGTTICIPRFSFCQFSCGFPCPLSWSISYYNYLLHLTRMVYFLFCFATARPSCPCKTRISRLKLHKLCRTRLLLLLVWQLETTNIADLGSHQLKHVPGLHGGKPGNWSGKHLHANARCRHLYSHRSLGDIRYICSRVCGDPGQPRFEDKGLKRSDVGPVLVQ